MAELPTPSQTVGPFFNIGMPGEPPGDGPLRISGTVYDGEGEPVADALIETWQADSGTFHRAETDAEGRYELATVESARQLHPRCSVRARVAQAPGDEDLLRSGRRADASSRAATRWSRAAASDGGWVFDIRLQGEGETVFFDV